MSCDGKLAYEAFAGFFPGYMLVGKSFGVDDDEQVIIGAIAAPAILDPIAARV